jgi:exosortase
MHADPLIRVSPHGPAPGDSGPPAPPAPPAPGGETAGVFLRRNSLLFLLAGAAFLLLTWPALAGLAAYWSRDPDFSHGFLIPIVSAYLLYQARREIAALPARRSLAGLFVLALSLAVFLAAYFSRINTLQRLATWTILVSAVWFALGPAILRAKPFPFLFLLLCIPPHYSLLSSFRRVLKGFATRLAADTLSLAGYEASPQGNILVVEAHQLEVADACSGIRSLMAIVATAVLFAYLFRTGIWKGLALTITAVPVTIAINVLRIIVVAVALVSLDINLAEGFVHDLVGYAVFGLSLVLLYSSWRFYDWFFRWRPLEAGT